MTDKTGVAGNHLTTRPRLPFSPYEDVMASNEGQNKLPIQTSNGPYAPGAFQPGLGPNRPPGPMNPPGQFAPQRPPGSMNGFGQGPPAMRPPQVQNPNAGPPRPQGPPMFNPAGQPPQTRPYGQMPPPPSSTQNANSLMNGPGGMNMYTQPTRPPLPASSGPGAFPPVSQTGQRPPTSLSAFGSNSTPRMPPPPGVPNANAVSYNGNSQEPPSEKNSRQPSPVSGTTIDALEGQFTPGPGAPSSGFPGAQGNPVPSQVPGNFNPQVSQGQVRPSGPPGPPRFPPGNQFVPPHPGVQSGASQPPVSQPPYGLGPPQQGTQPASTINSSAPQPPSGAAPTGFPPVSNSPLRFAPPPPSSNSGLVQPPPPNASGFPPPPTSSNMPPGFPPPPAAGQRYPLPPTSSATSRYPPPPGTNQVPGFPPMPGTAPNSQHMGQPGMPPMSQPGMPPMSQPGMPPMSQPGMPPMSQPGMPPMSQPGMPPMSQPGMPPMSQPGMPPMSQPGMPPMNQPGTGPPTGQYQGGLPGSFAGKQPGGMYANNVNAMTQNFGQMGMQDSNRAVNLLNERNLVPPEGVETAKPTLPHDFKKVNCSPDIFRCTLNAIPQSSGLLTKARLPLGILIHPFRDLSQLPVIQSSVIVRCRSCRTYINPFVVVIDQRRWKCNLCFRVNELPEEFSFDPVSKTYGDPQRRPEVKSATIEFIAPSEYMLRPPQPAVYLFLLDVSFNAVETGYLSQFCQVLSDELDKLPGDARTTVGFLCYDRALYYFNLAEGLSQPQMLCVPDLEDPFLPCPDNLLVNLHESKELIQELLAQMPTIFQGNLETGSALGAALQSAHKMMSPTGGRVTVMQTCLPTIGPGALQNRDTGNSSGKNVTNIGPAIDFYKKLSLDCSAQQIAVDLFMLNGQYADIATLSCISKYSAGCVYHYPSFHTMKTPSLVDKFDADLRRYLTRKIGFESVMRIRCTRGLSIHTFHGNFFVRSTDLLSLPNVNPDAGFGMQMSIEDNLTESSTVSFQAALLYTSSKGERRIRVHTLCVPVTNQINEVFAAADQQAVATLLAKMAVDRSMNSAIGDARDAMINAPVDTLQAYSQQMTSSQRVGALLAPHSLRLLPMYMLAMLKSTAFNLSSNTKIDDRVFAMLQCKVQPLCYLVQSLYPHLYPLHKLSMENPIKRGKEEIASTVRLQLSSANIDRTGLFLMDTGDAMYLLVGSGTPDYMCQDIFDKPNFMSIPDDMIDLPELENDTSEMVRCFVNYLMDSRPNGITFLVIRDDSKNRHLFFQHMLEDRTENSMSYYEFLQFLQGKMKG